jgi:hypothetical protein
MDKLPLVSGEIIPHEKYTPPALLGRLNMNQPPTGNPPMTAVLKPSSASAKESSSEDDQPGVSSSRKRKKRTHKKKAKKPQVMEPTLAPSQSSTFIPREYPPMPLKALVDEQAPTWQDLQVTENYTPLLERLYSPEGHPILRPLRYALPSSPPPPAIVTAGSSLMERLGLQDTSIDIPHLLTRISGYNSDRLARSRQDVLRWLNSIFRTWKFPIQTTDVQLRREIPPLQQLKWKEAVLIMPVRSELRLRYWLLCEPDLTIRELLPRFLRNGVGFNLQVPLESLNSIMDKTITRYGEPPVYSKIEPIKYPQNVSAMLRDYETNVMNILRRPHAIRSLPKGGLLWRIALQYISPALVMDFLEKPSEDIRGWLHGVIDENGMSEKLTDDEINGLLGITTNYRSIWPPLDVFEESCHWIGQWTPTNEEWWTGRMAMIKRDDPDIFLRRSSWKANYGRLNLEIMKGNGLDGSEGQAKWLCDTISKRWPALFEGRDFKNI